jgi:single-strand DNA-binding protein
MPYFNHCTFIGNLTRAPELRLQPTADKQALCLLSVAINRDSRDERGERTSHTTFINDVEVWGATGEACAHFLTLGSMVLVEGRMELDQWQDRKTGAKRSRLKVVAENVQFLRIKRPDDGPNPDRGPAPPDEPPPEPTELRTTRRRARSALMPA